MPGAEHCIVRKHECVFDRVLQFTHIARPGIGAQKLQHFRVDLRWRFTELLRKAVQESVREFRQILASFPQRRDFDLEGL